MVEKIFRMKRGKKHNRLRSQSADLLYSRKKKKPPYWKQMLTLCQLLKMEGVHLSHCSYKGVLMAFEFLIDHLCSQGKDSRNCMGSEMKSACQFNGEAPRNSFFFLSCKIKDIFQNKKGLFEREITVYSLKIFKGQSAL